MRPNQADEDRLAQVLRSVEASLSSASVQVIHDAPVRVAYQRQVERGIAEIRRRFAEGQFASVEAAAREANLFRNQALDALRLRTSPLGGVVARNLKESGLDFNTAVAKYTHKLFGDNAQFPKLNAGDRNRVFAQVLERSGIVNADVSRMLRRLAPAARAVILISAAYTVYEITTSENKEKALLREGASFGAGVAGGAAGGALAGLMCGPGAPVCVTVGAFVGGALAAFGVQFAVGD